MTIDRMVENAVPKALFATTAVSADALVAQFCAANGLTCSLLQAVDRGLMLLVAMMMLDLVTGVIAAHSSKTPITSRRFGEGVKRKVGVLLVVAATMVLEMFFKDQVLNFDGLLLRWTLTWFIATEALSLYENASTLGLPMPPHLKKALDWMLAR